MGSSNSEGSPEGSDGEQGSDASDEGSAEASGSPVDDLGAEEPGGAAEGQADGSDADELLDIRSSGDSASGSALDIADDQEGTVTTAAAQALRDSGNAAAQPVAERVNDSIAPAKGDPAGKQPAVKQPTAKRSRQADELDQSKRAKLDGAIPETYDDFQVSLSRAHLHALQTLMIHALQDQAQLQIQVKARARCPLHLRDKWAPNSLHHVHLAQPTAVWSAAGMAFEVAAEVDCIQPNVCRLVTSSGWCRSW